MEQLPILSDSLPIPRKDGIQIPLRQEHIREQGILQKDLRLLLHQQLIQLLSVLSLSHLFDQCGLTTLL